MTGNNIRPSIENLPTSSSEEMADTEKPVVLVQDYHFALLPRMIKEQRPDARVAIFWHIPWPNPEAFGICPWQRELVDGLLGADLIGFHIQAIAIIFSRRWIARWNAHTTGSISLLAARATTLVRPFPISVDFTRDARKHAADIHGDRAATRCKILDESGM